MTAKEHEQELADLYTFFQAAKFPETPFSLNKYTIVHDPKLLVDMEILKIQRYNGSDHVRESMFVTLRTLKELCLKIGL